MRTAILTINDNGNYGNRLQNYATQQILEKIGVDVETIENIGNTTILEKKIKNYLKKIIPKRDFRRYNNFLKFDAKVKYSSIIINNKNIPSYLKEKYDFFITGSDQVWNPKIGRLTNIDLLKFANNEQRISFSASLGISELPEEYKKIARNELKNFKAISVREDAGKKIVEELTKRNDIEVLIDPTMVLTNKEWDKVSQKPKQLKKLKGKQYILNYFLGDVSDKVKKKIETFAKENNCEIINLLEKNDPFYTCNPSEFLWLEKNAFLVCTDSFHSSVFAILYDKPFIVFERAGELNNMGSRIDTLLSKLELKERKYNGEISNKSLIVDYSNSYKILEEERKKSIRFLKRALNFEGE